MKGGEMEFPFMSKEGNAVELLRKDHEEVKALFRSFTSAVENGEKQRIVREAIRALELHAAIEETVFYPAVRKDSPDAKDKLEESLEEHHVVAFLMEELRGMAAEDERYAAKFRVLAENVKHHIKEEEAELFARARTGRLDLVELGKKLERAKASLHSAPHPVTKKKQGNRRSPGRSRSAPSRSRREKAVKKRARRAA
jgi:hemerythrin superfamily protein